MQGEEVGGAILFDSTNSECTSVFYLVDDAVECVPKAHLWRTYTHDRTAFTICEGSGKLQKRCHSSFFGAVRGPQAGYKTNNKNIFLLVLFLFCS